MGVEAGLPTSLQAVTLGLGIVKDWLRWGCRELVLGDVGNWGVSWVPTLSESPLSSLLGVLLENLLVGL